MAMMMSRMLMLHMLLRLLVVRAVVSRAGGDDDHSNLYNTIMQGESERHHRTLYPLCSIMESYGFLTSWRCRSVIPTISYSDVVALWSSWHGVCDAMQEVKYTVTECKGNAWNRTKAWCHRLQMNQHSLRPSMQFGATLNRIVLPQLRESSRYLSASRDSLRRHRPG